MLSRKYAKTIELLIYIISKLGDKSTNDSTLFGKALFFIDSTNYVRTGNPISNLSYIKQSKGPAPKPSKFLPIRKYLISIGDLEKVEADYFKATRQKFIAKRKANMEVFSKEEKVLIDEVLATVTDPNATQVRKLTNLFDCWNIAQNNEELPFYSILLRHREPSPQDLAWAESVIKKDKKSHYKYASR